MFLFALCASAGLAAYAGDVASRQCGPTISGNTCERGAVVAVIADADFARSML